MIEKQTVYLDRNEYNYGPAPEVEKVLRNFDPDKLCFYTRIYDEGKKSILSDYIAELYNIPEKQVILGYGGEDILKQVVHYFLSGGQKQAALQSSGTGAVQAFKNFNEAEFEKDYALSLYNDATHSGINLST